MEEKAEHGNFLIRLIYIVNARCSPAVRNDFEIGKLKYLLCHDVPPLCDEETVFTLAVFVGTKSLVASERYFLSVVPAYCGR